MATSPAKQLASPAEQLAKAKRQRREEQQGQFKHRRSLHAHATPGKTRAVRKRYWVCAIRPLRESLGLTIRDVADAVGMTVSGLWDIEHGTDPMLTTVARLTEFYGKGVRELWPERIEPDEACKTVEASR